MIVAGSSTPIGFTTNDDYNPTPDSPRTDGNHDTD
jgi:hypothetical protein